LRNDGKEFPNLGEAILPGPTSRGNRVALKIGQPELLGFVVSETKGDMFRAENFSTGKEVSVVTASELPAGADYAVGNFRGSALGELLFYKPGERNLLLQPVEEPAAGQLRLAKGNSFDLAEPIRRVVVLNEAPGQKLLVIFGEGEKAGIFNFDGLKAPTLLQTIVATNELLTCAASVPGGLIAFSRP